MKQGTKKGTRYVAAYAGAMLLAGCASSVTMEPAATPAGPAAADSPPVAAYRYQGEKYGPVTVQWSDELAADPEKMQAARDIMLDKAIVNHLLKHKLYNQAGDHSIAVVVDGFRMRNTVNAIMFGFMAGSDRLSGTVTLRDKDGTALTSFRIDTDYALGGFAGGQRDGRAGWLAGKFAELTATTILDPTKANPAESTAGGSGGSNPEGATP